MPHGSRKPPTSGKHKKTQLTLNRKMKSAKTNYLVKRPNGSDSSEEEENQIDDVNKEKLNYQPSSNKSSSNRYVLQFHRETDKQIKESKIQACKKLNPTNKKDMEAGDIYFEGYDFPKRPLWKYGMDKGELERNENRYFTEYIQGLEKWHKEQDRMLSYCELNLETWRQLWRVLELSDIVLIIVDVRYPTFMFPPSLHEYVTKELGKEMILVLNKIDLSPASVVLAWKKYFEEKYKSVHVVLFTSFPAYNMRGNVHENSKGMKIRRRKGTMQMVKEGAKGILKACKDIVKEAVDLTSWDTKILEEYNNRNANQDEEDEDDDDDEDEQEESQPDKSQDFDFEEHIKFRNGVLTIGCVGFPNSGKSSLMNAIMGRKVVSVSKTPGHTKHFQTNFLTNNVCLCDCPGLVFPSSTPRKLQVLMGSYPIAQLREPYASIAFLAERLNLPHLFNVRHSLGSQGEWSAMDICDAWALKRGFLTAKAARPDTYRAANNILRMALDGKLSLSFTPEGFSANEEMWKEHPELEEVIAIQALKIKEEVEVESEVEESSEDEESDNGQSTVAKNPFALLGDSD